LGINDVSVVHKVLEVYKIFHKLTILFPKYERYVLGQKIENLILEILELILKASYLPKYKKKEILFIVSNKVDLLKLFIRILYELKILNQKKYLLLSEKILEIGKMIGGWIKTV